MRERTERDLFSAMRRLRVFPTTFDYHRWGINYDNANIETHVRDWLDQENTWIPDNLWPTPQAALNAFLDRLALADTAARRAPESATAIR